MYELVDELESGQPSRPTMIAHGTSTGLTCVNGLSYA